MSNGTSGQHRSPVTVIGLGLMGTALARAFLRDGHPTTVWNRSAGKAETLVAQGAARADTPAAAVSASPLVVVCVRDYGAVRDILDPVGGDLSGRVVTNLTTGSSQEGRDLARWAADRGAEYLDGAIMMTPPGIGQPETVVFYGGPRPVFAAHEPTLRVLGGKTTYLGPDTGLPSLYDLALLGIMWATLNGFLHALALVGTEGVDAATFGPHAAGWLTGVGSFLPGLAREVDAGEYLADDATLATQLPPIRHLVAESQTRGLNAELPRFTQTLIEQAITQGHAADSYARIIEQLRKPAA